MQAPGAPAARFPGKPVMLGVLALLPLGCSATHSDHPGDNSMVQGSPGVLFNNQFNVNHTIIRNSAKVSAARPESPGPSAGGSPVSSTAAPGSESVDGVNVDVNASLNCSADFTTTSPNNDRCFFFRWLGPRPVAP